MTTREQAFEIFRFWVAEIWGAKAAAQLDLRLSPEEPAGNVTASLAYAGRPWAVGTTLIRAALEHRYTLRVATRLLDAPLDMVTKVMIHEAVHVGYHGHDLRFRETVLRYGGTVSEEWLTSPGVKVERKEGHRFRVIATLPDEWQARAWARQEAQRVPGKYRLTM